MIIEEQQKFLKLLELLGTYGEKGNVLVFVDKQEKADDLVAQLIHKSYSCAPLHGGIDQFDRDSTISDFKMGRIKLMVIFFYTKTFKYLGCNICCCSWS